MRSDMDIGLLDPRPQGAIPGCPATIIPYVRQLLDRGFTVIPGSLPVQLCDEIREGFITFAARNAEIFHANRDDFGHYPRIVNLHSVYRPLLTLFSQNEKALAVQDYLFGREAVLYTSLFYERGSAQPIHRDTPYFTTRPEYRYLGVWIALEDTDMDNGPLIVVIGGHLIPEFDREAMAHRYYLELAQIDPGSPELWNLYQSEIACECEKRGLATERVCVNKGDTIIWHPQSPHGGAEIQNLRRTRYSIVMHTTPVGVPVYHQNVFFNPSMRVSDEAPYLYQQIEGSGRRYADFRDVSFGHVRSYSLSEFK